jgi:uncharacterized protein YdaU (DUF1376 family)
MSRPIKIRRFDFYPGDWLGGTVALSLAQRGLYITACAMIYEAGGPISKTDLRRAAGCRSDTLNRHLSKLIEMGKLQLRDDGMIDQLRCEREILRATCRIAAKTTIARQSVQNTDRLSSSELNETNAVTPSYARATVYQQEGEDVPSGHLSTDVGSGPEVRAAPCGRAGIPPQGRSPPLSEIINLTCDVLGPAKVGLVRQKLKFHSPELVTRALCLVKTRKPQNPVRYFIRVLEPAPEAPPPETVPPPSSGPSRRLTPEEIDAIYARKEAA